MHRVVPPVASVSGAPDAERALWAAKVAETYKQLDFLVSFDVVIGPDRDAETNRIEPVPSTLLVVEIHGGPHLDSSGLPDLFLEPGERTAVEMALIGIARADLVVAPSDDVSRVVESLVDREVVTLAPPIAMSAAARTPEQTERLEMCCVGDLTSADAPELALAVLAALHHEGRDVHLTFVGRDCPTGPGGASYRRSVLIPLIEQLDCGQRSVRFIDELDPDTLGERLSFTHIAIQPYFASGLPVHAVTLCGAGLPIVTRSQFNAVAAFAPTDGPLVLDDVDDAGFVASAVAFITEELSTTLRGNSAREAALERFDIGSATDLYLDAFGIARAPSAIPAALRRPTKLRPKLAIAMLAEDRSDDTSRAIASILEHTDLQMSLTLIVDAGTTLPAVALEGRNVTIVAAASGTSASARRNFAITTLEPGTDFLVFVDNHVEVESGWWERHVAEFARDPNIGLVSESGYDVDSVGQMRSITSTDARKCRFPADFCLFIRPLTVTRVGYFDEHVGGDGVEVADSSARALRCGDWSIAVSSKRVFHRAGIEHAPDTSRALEIIRRYEHAASSRFLVLCDIDEALSDPAILNAFSNGDDAALALRGSGTSADLEHYLDRLKTVAAEVGFDLENGPQLIVLVQDPSSDKDVETLAHQAHCILSSAAPNGVFAHLIQINPRSGDLRSLAARAWGSRYEMSNSV